MDHQTTLPPSTSRSLPEQSTGTPPGIRTPLSSELRPVSRHPVLRPVPFLPTLHPSPSTHAPCHSPQSVRPHQRTNRQTHSLRNTSPTLRSYHDVEHHRQYSCPYDTCPQQLRYEHQDRSNYPQQCSSTQYPPARGTANSEDTGLQHHRIQCPHCAANAHCRHPQETVPGQGYSLYSNQQETHDVPRSFPGCSHESCLHGAAGFTGHNSSQQARQQTDEQAQNSYQNQLPPVQFILRFNEAGATTNPRQPMQSHPEVSEHVRPSRSHQQEQPTSTIPVHHVQLPMERINLSRPFILIIYPTFTAPPARRSPTDAPAPQDRETPVPGNPLTVTPPEVGEEITIPGLDYRSPEGDYDSFEDY